MKHIYQSSLTVALALSSLCLSSLPAAAAAPSNDNFANPVVLPSQAEVTDIPVTLNEATAESAEPARGIISTADESVWYSWVAPKSGRVSVSVVSNSTRHGLIFDGDSKTGGKIIGYEQISTRPVSFFAVQGHTYRICIFNYWSVGVNGNAPFTMAVGYVNDLPAETAYVAPLSNDAFANPTVLNPAGQKVVFSMRDANYEAFENTMVSDAGVIVDGNGGVWASWFAPATGKVSFSAESIGNETVRLLVGRGTTINEFRQNLLVDSAATGSLTVNCRAGESYIFYILNRYDDQVFATLSLEAKGPVALFIPQAGSFAGSVGSSGYLDFKLTKTGAFTGKLYLNGQKYPVSGKLNANGDFTGTVKGASVPFTLNLDTSASTAVPGSIVISGTAGGQAFTARHSVYVPATALAAAGSYTGLFAPTDSSASVPQGSGVGFIKVSSKGAVTCAGKLADGSPHTSSGPLVGDGSGGAQWFLYDGNLAPKLGLLSGTVAFSTLPTSDCAGSIHWIKPARPTGKYYPDGFDTTVTLRGARYVKPVREIALNLPVAQNNAEFVASGGGLTAALTADVTLSVANKITVSGANAERLKMTIVPGTGAYTGSFNHPVTAKPVKFTGAILRNSTAPTAGGFFLSADGLSGNVTLAP